LGKTIYKVYVHALIIKVLIIFAVSGALFFLTGLQLAGALSMAAVLVLITTLAIDAPFIPILGRGASAILDAVIAVPLLWGMIWLYTAKYPSPTALVVIATIFGFGEWLLHANALSEGIIKKMRDQIKQ